MNLCSRETNRLVLREFIKEDLEDVHKYSSDTEVVKFLTWGPNTEEQTEKFLHNVISCKEEEQRKDYDIAVILKEEGALIGACKIHIDSFHNKEASISYCYKKEFWGKNYAAEAGKAMVKFAFNELGMHRVYATCDPDNIKSARVLEKIGMKREGFLRENKLVKNQWKDSLLYSIISSDIINN
ncbi:GNAT family N-acetyltransferase [Clostridium hydrogeniformans]|uniref:GNAT family N-acetyltransferase n=1 Tax=Clostridium hydrogeniformans TaxID=349933 RepID=UPI000481ED0A|nr:GNAT family protein [Clostridium hydrogeniformans]